MNRIVFFIGMMGAGKTVWGKLLAEAMSLRFQDLDDEIVAAAGQSIPAVFDQHGELYFRELEARQLRLAGQQTNLLLSCGGGTPCFFDNMAWMKQHGVVVWLHPPAAEITERIWRVKHKRPLIANAASKEDAYNIVTTLMEKRMPWYQQAHIIITDLVLDLPALGAAIEQHWKHMENNQTS